MTTQIEPEATRALHVFLDDSTHKAFRQFAADQGVSMSGLIEGMARRCEDLNDLDDGELVRQGRRVDALRRRRR